MVSHDVVVIGGGIYGSFLGYQLARQRPGRSFALLEKESRLFTRAAASNQGQLHLGYLYGGHPQLAADCMRNMPAFEMHFGAAVDHEVTAYYGIHRDSSLSPEQYEQFCRQVGLPLLSADDRPPALFSDEVVAAYRTAEKTFNAARLAAAMTALLDQAGVEVRPSCAVERIGPTRDGRLALSLATGETVTAKVVFNTAFAGINGVHERSGLPPVPTRYDLLLHFLVELPSAYDDVGGSVVAGPYAFLSPSSFRGHHILASGQYRTVVSGIDVAPAEVIEEQEARDRYARAIESAREWLPVLRAARYRGYTLGTSVKYRDPETGGASPDVVADLHFNGLANYHVIVAGRVSCVFDAIEPARRAMVQAGL
jgi:glycine/D-amino acid oxidase-like deaminating enzyme